MLIAIQVVDLENKLKGGKNTSVVFGFQKIQRKEKITKENDFLMFICLIKIIRLYLVLISSLLPLCQRISAEDSILFSHLLSSSSLPKDEFLGFYSLLSSPLIHLH